MEEYLQNMKALRFQMNEVEDRAANVSVEEQKQKTSIQTMEMDLQLVKSETKCVKEETEQMKKTKGKICCLIVEKQNKIIALETESSTLSKTLELLQQEKVSLSAKLKENSAYYTKVTEGMIAELQEQQNWANAHKLSKEVKGLGSVEDRNNWQTQEIEGNCGTEMLSIERNFNNLGDETNKKYKDLMTQLESAKATLDELLTKKTKLALENSKSKQLVEQLEGRLDDFPPELKVMDIKALEEEHKALLSDKAGEAEYLQSLHDRIEQLKGISHVVKCGCGEEYKVELKCLG